MQIRTEGTDDYGAKAYEQLFDTVMSDIGKAVMMDDTLLILKPEVPLFVFSVKLRNKPESLKIKDAASIRTEGKDVHMTISDERYAPEILKQLWDMYGRSNVQQSTRFDISIANADSDKISEIEISSSEEVLKEVIGAIWRAMPEGIKARHTFITGNVVTIMATEEIVTEEIRKEAEKVHKRMVG